MANTTYPALTIEELRSLNATNVNPSHYALLPTSADAYAFWSITRMIRDVPHEEYSDRVCVMRHCWASSPHLDDIMSIVHNMRHG